MVAAALEGLKILEYSHFVSGPYCARLLADLGAEVVKVEDPGEGDEARKRGPFPGDLPDPETSGLFLYLNSNKLGITLNLRTPTGREIFQDLARQADVFIENNPPSLMKDLGLDYDSLKKVNPGLIMTSITPFGQTGPYRDFKSYYLNTFHAGGEGYMLPAGLGWVLNPDREPLKAGGFIGEYDIGVAAAVATLGSVYWGRCSGQGQHIDISGMEVLAGLMRLEFAPYNDGNIIDRASWSLPVGGLMQCKDGFVEVIALEEHMYYGLLDLVGNPEWAKEERYQFANIMRSYLRHSGTADEEARQRVNNLVEEWMLQHTKEEILVQAQAKGCAAGIVATPHDIIHSEQLQHRQFFKEMDHPRAGKIPVPSTPCKYSETPYHLRRPAPGLGEHNQEILGRRLDISKERLAMLRQAGII